MTKLNKYKTNWFYVVLGLFLCLAFLLPDKKDLSENELVTKTIIVTHIQKINYWKNENKYRLFSLEYKCAFVIKTAGTMAEAGNELDNILKNDTLIIKIHSTRLLDLDNKLEDIPIYSLKKNGKSIYEVDGYNTSQKAHDRRWSIIFIVMGILFLLRGFIIVSSKAAYILGGVSLIIIITFRLLNIW